MINLRENAEANMSDIISTIEEQNGTPKGTELTVFVKQLQSYWPQNPIQDKFNENNFWQIFTN